MNEIKCGLVFPECGTVWKIVKYSRGDGLWLVECCCDSSFMRYKTDEEIKKILGLPIDK